MFEELFCVLDSLGVAVLDILAGSTTSLKSPIFSIQSSHFKNLNSLEKKQRKGEANNHPNAENLIFSFSLLRLYIPNAYMIHDNLK